MACSAFVGFHFVFYLAFASFQATSGEDSLVLIPGNVTIAAIFGVNDLLDDECGRYDVTHLQEIQAVTWFVQSLNDVNFINGVTIGLEVYRTCKRSQMATNAAVRILNKYSVLTNISQDSPILFGILGPDRTAEAVSVSHLIGSLPDHQRPLQISGASTGEQLSDRTLYPNFFRVIPPDPVQIQVMLELLLELEWNYFAIVYDNDNYGRSAATELRRLAEGKQLCIPVFVGLPLDAASSDFVTAAGSVASQISSSADSGVVRGMVVFGGRTSIKKLIQTLEDQAKFVQLIVSEAVGFQTSVLSPDTNTVARGSLVTSPPYISLPEFASHWNELWTDRAKFDATANKNPWLRGYFDEIQSSCRTPNTCWDDNLNVRNEQKVFEGQSGQSKYSLYLGYQVKAAAVMATLLKRVHGKKCGSSFRGMCPELKKSITGRVEVQKTMERMEFNFSQLASVALSPSNLSSVRFDSKGEVSVMNGDTGYGVYNVQRTVSDGYTFKKVGTYSSGDLTINKPATTFYHDNGTALTWNQLQPAQCDVNHNCVQCERDVSNSEVYIEGDFYVIAIVPVHAKNTDDLLKCGEIKGVVGADLTQAVIYAVQDVNKKNGEFRNILKGRTVGLVGISSCGSSLLVEQRLMDFFSGRLRLPDGRNSSALMDHVMGVVGAFYSSNSIAASDTLTTLGRPYVQVSAASTNPDLKDRGRHPYFMRLVPSDDKQAQVMLDIVERLGANYIQVIYDSSTAYAKALFDKLQDQVATPNTKYSKVCIAQSIPTTPRSDASQYKYIVDKLRDKSSARVVIVILHAVEIEKVMDAILPLLKPEDDFLFLASESWGRRQGIIEGRTKLEGSLVLAQEIAVDQNFARYFADLDPTNSSALNPWLKFFWESRLNCYFDKSFERRGKDPNNPKMSCPIHFADDYAQDSRVPFHIQAVKALVKGFDVALTEACGSTTRSTCSALSSAKLVTAMHKVKLDLYSTGQNVQVFDSNGDGLVGFKVLKISRDLSAAEDRVIYTEIGQWTDEGLKLDPNDVKAVTSACPNSAECDRCSQAAHHMYGQDSGQAAQAGVPVFVTAGVGAVLGVIVVILVVVIICLVRRHNVLTKNKRLSQTMRRPVAATGDHYSHEYDSPNCRNSDREELPPPLPPPCHKRPSPNYLTPAMVDMAESPNL